MIKSDAPVPSSTVGRVAALNIANFADQAQKLIIEAQTKANALVAQATSRAREIEKAAADRGHAEGYQKGLADGLADGADRAFQQAAAAFAQQTTDLQSLLKKSVLTLEQQRCDILQQGRSELLDLALEIARKVTHVQAAGNIQVAQAQLGKALEMVSCQGPIQIRTCPAQFAQLEEYAGQFLAEMGLTSQVKFAADQQLQAGDVVLVTRNGQVDGRIETQLNNIVAALTGTDGAETALPHETGVSPACEKEQ